MDTAEGRLAEIVRRGLVLVALAVPLVAACWRLGARGSLGGFSFGIYLAVAALLVACEAWLPFERGWGSAVRGTATDFVYVAVATAMDKAIFVLCVGAIAAVGRVLSQAVGLRLWPTDWAVGWQVAAALVVADAATYVRHRVFHKSDFLWRFHRIHHSMTQLYWIRSAYTHPLEQLCILSAIMLPISLLGAGDQVVALVAFVFGLSGLLQHANVDARSSVLNRVFATPEVHRVHHGLEDGGYSNFSAFFVVMDLLCGTYRAPTRSATPMRVGLRDEPGFPTSFLTHLTMPFRRDPTGLGADGARVVAAANER